MIRIRDIALAFDHEPGALERAVLERLDISKTELFGLTIVRKSIDARQKNRILSVYTVDADVKRESELLSGDASAIGFGPAPDTCYCFPVVSAPPGPPPVIVGSGPCGLFAALILAQSGLRPLLMERGKDVTSRIRDVRAFWREGRLDPESNVPFGEGGAGTFSDGKLTTQIRDGHNRIRKVLEELVAAGAPEEILYLARPHIGTDNLVRVVRNLRKAVLSFGGQVRFRTKLTGIRIKEGKVAGVVVGDGETIVTNALVLAVGHSATDTFHMLHRHGIPMVPKPFSIGVRIEHPQAHIDKAQYGNAAPHPMLGRADYRLVHHCANGRSVYTFCMCPGGQVIASSSEPDTVVTNGMSLYARNGVNANSALLVGVGPADYQSAGPLAGMMFQRTWERKAFEAGGGNYSAPVQSVGDFLRGRPSVSLGRVTPSYIPGTTPGDLSKCLPDVVVEALRSAIPQMDKTLRGFAMPDAVMTAVESRSSSPVRILRDGTLQSPAVKGLYPAGEGAGYAGGIISSAVDGIRVAEAISAGDRYVRSSRPIHPPRQDER